LLLGDRTIVTPTTSLESREREQLKWLTACAHILTSSGKCSTNELAIWEEIDTYISLNLVFIKY